VSACFADENGHVVGYEEPLYGKEDCCVHGIMSCHIMLWKRVWHLPLIQRTQWGIKQDRMGFRIEQRWMVFRRALLFRERHLDGEYLGDLAFPEETCCCLFLQKRWAIK
jgi:hypothetical protein